MQRVILTGWVVAVGCCGFGCYSSEILFDSSSDGDISTCLFALADSDCPVDVATSGGKRYRLQQVRKNADRSINGIGIELTGMDSLGEKSHRAKYFAGRISADSIMTLEQACSSLTITVSTVSGQFEYRRWSFTEHGLDGQALNADSGGLHSRFVPTGHIKQISRRAFSVPLTVIAVSPVALVIYAISVVPIGPSFNWSTH